MDNVFVVTVTYGNRFHLLRRVIEAALREGVSRVIIADIRVLKSLTGLTKGIHYLRNVIIDPHASLRRDVTIHTSSP
ncbi:hypothetical protein [Methanothermobacter sp.]|uniref:hypothetical protein n=1 Tax=Methanothermobacter sp. TaxID=1884223 RepID=UPI003C76E03A